MNTLAKKLRNSMTDAESLLWSHLRRRNIKGYKFRRQYPVGNYIVDFVCLEANLVIELDGSQHFEQKEYDNQRSQWLEQNGFRTLRFWNNAVMNEMNSVLEVIWNALPPTQPPPMNGGRRGGGR